MFFGSNTLIQRFHVKNAFFNYFQSYLDRRTDTMDEELILIKRLDSLREKHRELDEKIKSMFNSQNDPLTVMRLKKEKLSLRDEINRLEREIYPDIIA